MINWLRFAGWNESSEMTTSSHIEIDISNQQLTWFQADGEMRCFPISTAKNGVGELMDSECTPRGKHRVAEKIGDGAAANTVFIGRRPSGEIYSPELAEQGPERDWILTRIIWLAGMEPGLNAGGNVDTKARYIYIHGTPENTKMREPGSHGCIRMRNEDIIELFDGIDIDTSVEIIE